MKPRRIGLSVMDRPLTICRDMVPSARTRGGCAMSQRRLRSFAVPVVLFVAVAAILSVRDGAAQGPITISLVDGSGDLSSTRGIIENYQKDKPHKVKTVHFQRAPAPDLPAKIKAQK